MDPVAIRVQTERVLTDPLFSHSKRYSDLLRYIVDRTLEGQHSDLKERVIGVEVFKRTPDFDTSLDPTVRVTANEVRRRLALYYSKADHCEEIRIDVPIRSYVAEFHAIEQQSAQPEPQVEPQATKRKHPYYWSIGVPVAIVILALTAWGLQRLLAPVPAVVQFWKPVLNGPGPVLFLIGSAVPSSGIPDTGQPTSSLGFAKPGMPLYQLNQFSQLRVGVSMTDVAAAIALSGFLRSKGKESIIHPAYGTNLSDLRSGPAVMLGNFQNEWALRLESDLRYHFVKGSELGPRWIEDKSNPANRNWLLDMSAPYEQVNNDYALISRVLDPTTGQWCVGIAGLTGLGTLAAQQLLIDPKGFEAAAANLPKGWEKKNLQIVLAVKLVQGSSGGSQVVAAYSW